MYRHSQQRPPPLTFICRTPPMAPRLSPTTSTLTSRKHSVICHLQSTLALNRMKRTLRRWSTNPSSPQPRTLSTIPWTNSSSFCTSLDCGGWRAFSSERDDSQRKQCNRLEKKMANWCRICEETPSVVVTKAMWRRETVCVCSALGFSLILNYLDFCLNSSYHRIWHCKDSVSLGAGSYGFYELGIWLCWNISRYYFIFCSFMQSIVPQRWGKHWVRVLLS